MEVNAGLTFLDTQTRNAQVWIGGVFNPMTWQLTWLDNTPTVNFGFPYAAGEPSNVNSELCLLQNTNFGVVGKQGKWEDFNCGSKRSALCMSVVV